MWLPEPLVDEAMEFHPGPDVITEYAQDVSIAFMLAVPNLLVATIGGWIYYVYRRAARAGRTAPESAVDPMRAATHLPASNDEATSARPSIGGAS